ncbi:MAG TPA: hypothetical protein VGX78_22200 [Pirellulales bacterium]|jgi:hypothetical protein|nr:hypothetical protein [Pirellulales bacterium]
MSGYLVGMDEAGYGPNLGPLVVSATVWQVPGDPRDADLYNLLRDVVTSAPERREMAVPSENGADPARARLLLADSKVVYKPAHGLADLELGLLSALAWAGLRPKTWRGLWDAVDADGFARVESLPWHDGYDRELACDSVVIDRRAAALRAGADAVGVRLVSVRSRSVFPEQWNENLDRHQNKSTVLSLVTLDLLGEVLAALDGGPIHVTCDKHGGRDRYRPLVQRRLTDALVETNCEGREESRYGWGRGEGRVEVSFCAKAERYLPVALASMASKYLRELSMDAFNCFWRRQVPGLAATAGYPLDAVRFKSDIAPAQQRLGIDDHILWRER